MKYKDLIDIINSKVSATKKKELRNIVSNENTLNIFSWLNLREDSHSGLISWLLDAKEKKAGSIQYYFLKNFIEFLCENAYLNVKGQNDFIKNILSDISVSTGVTCHFANEKCKYIDILLVSEKESFVCIIETKLDAPFNTSEKILASGEKVNLVQLEYYRDYIKNLNYKNKLLLVLCRSTNELYLKGYTVKKACKSNNIYSSLDNISQYTDISEEKFGTLLDKLQYKTLEHSDTVLLLHNAMRYAGLKRENFSKNLGIAVLTKIKNLLEDSIENRNNIAKIIYELEHEKQISTKMKNFNFDVKDFMNNLSEKEIFFVLNQYIEYWEDKHEKFVGGYSKIVDISLDNSIYSVYSQDIK